MKNIAFVIQRYGKDIVGGSETYCRELAERLSKYYEIDVITTCAKSYITWENVYDEGKTVENSINVYRFKTDKNRDKVFDKFYGDIINKENKSILDEIEWMNKQGPYSSDLLEFLGKYHYKYDLIIFVTYIYFNTYYGIQIAPQKSILIPTAHDEPPIYFSIFNTIFHLAQGFIFLTDEEKEFVYKKFDGISNKFDVIGMGIDDATKYTLEISNISQSLLSDIKSKYIIYIGRIDDSKNVGELINYYTKFKKETNVDLKLYLAGSLKMDLPLNDNIKYLGFVNEFEKKCLLENAIAFIMPSKFESFSIATLESLNYKTPVFVNAECEVLKGHVERSNAGLYYSNYEEFKIGLDFLIENTSVIEIMGNNGNKYISENYDWDVIVNKYIGFIDSFISNY